VRGEHIGEIPVTPPLLVSLIARELRASPRQPLSEVLAAIERAGELFATGTLAGQPPAEYARSVNQLAGLPLTVIEGAAAELSRAMGAIRGIVDAQVPRGVGEVAGAREPAASIRWVRRGSLFGVVAPSNHPGTHIGWLQALALGYKVMIKPGSRDPITPYRLALALLEAGLAPSMIAFVPGDHQLAAHVVESSDCALVFGGEGSARPPGARAHVVARGPGYSKIIAARDSALSAEAIAASVVSSASEDAGVKCSNASGLISDRADLRAIAEAITARMATLPARPLGDREARVPVFSIGEAHRLSALLDPLIERGALLSLGAGARASLVDFGDGSGTVRPALVACPRLTPDVLRTELPFPALWLARVGDVREVDDFGPTLVMGYLGSDDRFHQRLIDDPYIGRVIRGAAPTCRSHPLLPHDGFLAHALMSAKASIHSP
jgi:acyl-CoA reductase-like NAD-dependent aldehyde dehydrogenase